MKFDLQVLAQLGIEVAPIDDTHADLLCARRRASTVTAWTSWREKHLGHKPIPFSEVAGTGKSFIGFARVALDKATEYAAEDADVTLRLWRVLKPRLVAERMTHGLRDAGAAAGRGAGAHGASAAS